MVKSARMTALSQTTGRPQLDARTAYTARLASHCPTHRVDGPPGRGLFVGLDITRRGFATGILAGVALVAACPGSG